MDEPGGWVTALILIVFVALPGLIALLGVAQLMKVGRVQRSAAAVTGTVVEVKTRASGGSEPGDGPTYQAVFSYMGPEGTLVQGASAEHRRKPVLRVGDTAAIHVDFKTPGTVYERFGTQRTVALAMILIGGGMACIGMYALAPPV